MTKRLFVLPLIAVLLAGCGGSANEEEIVFISPKGAPTLAFYDQGVNPNFVTSGEPSAVLAELQKNDKDVVIFDSINGLKSIKANNANFGLAKIITGGNFYLAGIDKTADDKGVYPLPAADDVVVSFGQNLIPDVVYSKLCSDYWHIENNAKYVASVTDALAVLTSGQYSGGKVDYVFIAEPALTTAINKADANTFGKVSVVRNIRSEWKAYSGQDGIAQAGVFVNKASLETKPNKLKDFFTKLEDRIDTAISNPDVAKASLDLYGSATEQVARFGFNSTIMSKVQKDDRNGFGLVSSAESIDVNSFLESLGQSTFDDSYFVTI
jgi:hypothetical protein